LDYENCDIENSLSSEIKSPNHMIISNYMIEENLDNKLGPKVSMY